MALTKTVTGAINQMMCVNGTTAVLDAIHGALAFTMTGGVSNEFTTAGNMTNDNFRTVLGAQAPVLARATTNLLTYVSDNSTFEGNTVGGFTGASQCVIAADATKGWHGSHSLKQTCAGTGDASAYLDVTGLTSANPFTASCRVKATPGKTFRISLRGNISGYTHSPIITADGTWQNVTVSKTFAAGDTTYRRIYIWAPAGDLNEVLNWDAFQLEAGLVQTPYCCDINDDAVTRTATTMKIPTSTIGLTAGQSATIMLVVDGTPWAGNDSTTHFLFSAIDGASPERFRVYKHTDNLLYFSVGNKVAAIPVDATNWPAFSRHVIFCTVEGTSSCQIYLDGVAGTAGSSITRETGLNAWLCFGADDGDLNQFNGAILPAIWGRVLTNDEREGYENGVVAGCPYDFSRAAQYKTQVHDHSSNSDLCTPDPQDAANNYAGLGYDALAITDKQDTAHHIVTTFTPPPVKIDGSEYIVSSGSYGFHLIGLFTDYVATDFTANPTTIQTWIDAIIADGGISVYAHPHWIDHTIADLLAVERYVGIEVFNKTCKASGKGYSTALWDELLTLGKVAWGFAVDDAHSAAYEDFGHIEVLANSTGGIQAEIVAGNFYAVEGNGLSFTNISVSNNVITVTLSGVATTIKFIGAGGAILQTNTSVASATYTLTGNEKYVRIEAANATTTLWSQPLFAWGGLVDYPRITVTGLLTGNAARLYDSAGNVHASAVEAGGTATLTYTLD